MRTRRRGLCETWRLPDCDLEPVLRGMLSRLCANCGKNVARPNGVWERVRDELQTDYRRPGLVSCLDSDAGARLLGPLRERRTRIRGRLARKALPGLPGVLARRMDP